MINVLSVVWSLPGGGVSHYVGSIHKLNHFNGISIKHVIIRKKQWQVHQGLKKELLPLEIIIRSRFDPIWVLKLLKLIRNMKCELLFVHGFNGYLVANICRLLGMNIPVLSSYHGPYHSPVPSKRRLVRMINGYARFFLKHMATHIITVTRNARRDLLSLGIREDKITAVHNGIQNIKDINTGGFRTSLLEMGISDRSVVLGATSGFHPIKGLEYLIRATPKILGQHADTHVLLFGSGPLEYELRELVRSFRLEDHIHFMGFQEQIERWLSILDVFILPSLSECHSIGLLEAMRAELPIVCTELSGNLETIRDGIDGMVVPPKNSEALSNAIIHLIHNPDSRHSMGLSARNRFETYFTESSMLENTLDVLMKCKMNA